MRLNAPNVSECHQVVEKFVFLSQMVAFARFVLVAEESSVRRPKLGILTDDCPQIELLETILELLT